MLLSFRVPDDQSLEFGVSSGNCPNADGDGKACSCVEEQKAECSDNFDFSQNCKAYGGKGSFHNPTL